jgi:hypothetical protein
MLLGVNVGEVTPLLSAVIALATGGVIVSGMWYTVDQVQLWLSRWTRVGEPDPTCWFRYWRRLFDTVFHPVGKQVVSEERESVTNRALYEMVVGVAATAAFLGTYILVSGTILGGMVVSYYSMGVVPDLSPLIESVAAFCLLVGIVAILHARERSKDVV